MTSHTLETAVTRIHELEKRLERIQYALQARTRYNNIDELLAEAPSKNSSDANEAQEEVSPSSTPSAIESSSDNDIATAAAPSAIDISPYVLKALAIRKSVHTGTIEDGETALKELLEENVFSESQQTQLRQWAGL